jgi:hypothetical protein
MCRIARNRHRRAPSVRDVLCSPDALKETGRTHRLALFTFDLTDASQAYQPFRQSTTISRGNESSPVGL